MTVLSEIGDNTSTAVSQPFKFMYLYLSNASSEGVVLSGCMASLIVMTILSAGVRWAAPNLAFSITFFGEWGDRSQLATIGLAADEDPFGVVLVGILGQALCTATAVIGERAWRLGYLRKLLHSPVEIFSLFSESNPSSPQYSLDEATND
ncbi:hypothetical protein F3Y22_tig00116995pilonHSYRG00140 [Hibiscus syriacus]|uniref:GDT1 family protein n=1 Tax=Hibiscus syriacus TaxID=106335 RepID=A0A6A2XLW6_HIBSY|nr:hypothetical protein F3Y22_tig00116995pilonHSYRG00140 [Hibiscus syriacus]